MRFFLVLNAIIKLRITVLNYVQVSSSFKVKNMYFYHTHLLNVNLTWDNIKFNLHSRKNDQLQANCTNKSKVSPLL